MDYIIISILIAIILLIVYKFNKQYITIYLTGNQMTSEQWIDKWEKMLDLNLPIRFTTNSYCDIIFVINEPHELDIDFVNKNKYKTIVAHMEPTPYLNEQEDIDSTNYLDTWIHKNTLNNIEWFFPITFSQIKNPVYLTEKTMGDRISIVISSKYDLEGHKKRIKFIKYLEKNSNLKLDIYGADNKFKFKNYKGKVPDDDKSKVLIPYKYHFNCENYFIDNYITEKFTDSMLCETFLFYGGPSNVLNIYPQYGYQLLDMDDFEKSMNIMENCISNDVFNLKNIREIKHAILYQNSISYRIMKTINSCNFKTKCRLRWLRILTTTIILILLVYFITRVLLSR